MSHGTSADMEKLRTNTSWQESFPLMSSISLERNASFPLSGSYISI